MLVQTGPLKAKNDKKTAKLCVFLTFFSLFLELCRDFALNFAVLSPRRVDGAIRIRKLQHQAFNRK